MEFEAANKFLKQRLTMATDLSSRGISETIPPQIRARCFFSARVAESRIIRVMRRVSDAHSRGDVDLAGARTLLKKWLDKEHPGKYDRDDRRISNIYSTARLDLILRQNAAMAAAVGKYEVGMDPDIMEYYPSWRYITGPNSRDAHAALDGKVFLKIDPIWSRIFPPWEFNCNCDVEDSDEKPQSSKKLQIEEPASGYRFDPKTAFEPSLDEIKDSNIRAITKEQIQSRFAGEWKSFKETSDQPYVSIQHPDTKKVKTELETAMNATGDIWKNPKLKSIPVDFMESDEPGYYGHTTIDGAGRVVGVKVCKSSPHPALTFVHETLHVIDNVFLTNATPAVKKSRGNLIAKLKDTDEYRSLLRNRDKLASENKLSRKKKQRLNKLNDWLKDEELLARGYAQFLAEKKGGLLLEELKKEIIVDKTEFFISKKDEIFPLYNELMKDAGLL